jgi:hypothetical protein
VKFGTYIWTYTINTKSHVPQRSSRKVLYHRHGGRYIYTVPESTAQYTKRLTLMVIRVTCLTKLGGGVGVQNVTWVFGPLIYEFETLARWEFFNSGFSFFISLYTIIITHSENITTFYLSLFNHVTKKTIFRKSIGGAFAPTHTRPKWGLRHRLTGDPCNSTVNNYSASNVTNNTTKHFTYFTATCSNTQQQQNTNIKYNIELLRKVCEMRQHYESAVWYSVTITNMATASLSLWLVTGFY